MIDTKKSNFLPSTAPALCSRCIGVGSVWAFKKEYNCERCNGSGLEPKAENIKKPV